MYVNWPMNLFTQISPAQLTTWVTPNSYRTALLYAMDSPPTKRTSLTTSEQMSEKYLIFNFFLSVSLISKLKPDYSSSAIS